MGLILNTRPTFYQERFHVVFGELPWAIYDCPITLPEPVAMDVPPAHMFDALIFTSQLALATFAHTTDWLHKKVFAVGPGTAEYATAIGYKDVTQTGQDIDDMRRFLSTARFTSALYPSAEDVSADLPQEFPGRIRREVIYKMAPRANLPQQLVTLMTQGTHIVAPLFSRRGAEILADLLKAASVTPENANIDAIGISANVFSGETGAKSGPWRRQFVADNPVLGELAAKTGEVIESSGS